MLIDEPSLDAKYAQARQLEDFSMWTMLQRGGQKADIPLLKELVGDWITMVTQKNAGQAAYRKKDQINWANAERAKMGILCEAVALVLSGELDKLEEDAG